MNAILENNVAKQMHWQGRRGWPFPPLLLILKVILMGRTHICT